MSSQDLPHAIRHRWPTKLAIACSVLFSLARLASADDTAAPAPPPIDISRLDTALVNSESLTLPESSSRLPEARDRLQAASESLQRWLRPETENGARWNRYLGWEDVATELALNQSRDESPSGEETSEDRASDKDTTTDRRRAQAQRRAELRARRAEIEEKRRRLRRLNQALDRVNADVAGLEYGHFRRFATALARYIDAFVEADVQDRSAAYATQIKQLRKELADFSTRPTAKRTWGIAQRFDYLTALRENQLLQSAFDSVFMRCNVDLKVSQRFLNYVAQQPINDRGPVSDVILGTTIRGTAETRGLVTLHTIPASDRALLEFRSSGTIASRTRGVNGPAVIHSSASTSFKANKQVELTDPVFRVMPSTATATTNSRIRSVQAKQKGLVGFFISKVASRRAAQSKAQADRIAADHAETRIRAEFDQEVLESVRQLRRTYRDEFRYRFLRQNAYPRAISLHTSSDALSVSYVQAAEGQLAATSSAPLPFMDTDVLLRIHESAVTNYAAIYAGEIALTKNSAEGDVSIEGNLPQWLREAIDDWGDRRNDKGDSEATNRSSAEGIAPSSQGDKGGPALVDPSADEEAPAAQPKFQPWTITLRRTQPITVQFKEERLLVTVHAEKIASGKDEFSGWDLQAKFSLQGRNGAIRLKREGEIEVFPTSFDPELDGRISTRQLPIRSNLMKLINRLSAQGDGIPETLDLPAWQFTGDLGHLRAPTLDAWDLDRGWLTLGWQLR